MFTREQELKILQLGERKMQILFSADLDYVFTHQGLGTGKVTYNTTLLILLYSDEQTIFPLASENSNSLLPPLCPFLHPNLPMGSSKLRNSVILLI